jgi:receptor protein-tyrosine kinase
MAGSRNVAVARADERRLVTDRTLGATCVELGLLSPEQVDQVLHLQKEDGSRFGDAAIKLGVLTSADVEVAVARQFDFSFDVAAVTRFSRNVVTACAPFSAQAEVFRTIRSQLILRWLNGKAAKNTIAVASSEHGEGRSSVAANLAVTFSQSGKRTLLVDADLRAPCQHRLFGIENRVGFATLLCGRGGPETIQAIEGFPKLSILPAGGTPPDPAELLARSTFEDLRSEFSTSFDVVIFDTPPAVKTVDAHIVAAALGTALLVTRRHVTRTSQLQALANSLVSLKATVVGTVLNEF